MAFVFHVWCLIETFVQMGTRGISVDLRWGGDAQDFIHVPLFVGFQLVELISEVLYHRPMEFFLVTHLNLKSTFRKFLVA